MVLSFKDRWILSDQYVIILKNTVNQMVYKHAISTIVPAKTVKILEGKEQ